MKKTKKNADLFHSQLLLLADESRLFVFFLLVNYGFSCKFKEQEKISRFYSDVELGKNKLD